MNVSTCLSIIVKLQIIIKTHHSSVSVASNVCVERQSKMCMFWAEIMHVTSGAHKDCLWIESFSRFVHRVHGDLWD